MRGQSKGRKNLKQRRSWGGLKKRSGGKLEGKCGVRGWVLRRGSDKRGKFLPPDWKPYARFACFWMF